MHWLLQALAQCHRQTWQLDIVGDGPLRQELEQLASHLGLADRVRFHGYQAETERWYQDADLLLLPSQSDSLGLVLLEAMSLAVPCLAVRPDGVTCWNVNEEIIEHGRAVILADGEEAFRREVREIVRAPDPQILLGNAARDYVLEHHTWDAHLDRDELLFDELTQNR